MENNNNNDNKLRKTIKIKFPSKYKKQEENNQGLIPPSKLELASTTTDDDYTMEDGYDDDELEESEFREDEEEDGDDDGDGDDDYEVVNKEAKTAVSNNKVCPYCGKECNSGKALGGHLWSHIDPEPEPEPNCLSMGPNTARFGGKVYPCSICSKEFKSSKALYGHMRAHPDRDYRGMKAPGSGSGLSSGHIKPGRAMWKAKDKRSLKGYDAEDDEMEMEAEAEAEASSSNWGFTEDDLEVAEVLSNFAEYGGITDNDKLDEDESNPSNNYDDQRIIDDNEEEEEYSPPDKVKLHKEWECSTCNKTFPSFQALGGHMSSSGHTKNKAAAAVGAAGGDEGSPPPPPQFKCKNCDQSFSTRQGLGGHQRFHHHNVPSSEPIRSQTDGQSDNTRLDIDLNQIPKDED